MKKILIPLLIISFLFSMSYQSILINRNVSNIPFVANIFVSTSKVKKVSTLYDGHAGYYSRKLNDSINSYHQIYEKPSYIHRVISATWEIKYKKMNSKNLLFFLTYYDLSLFTKLDNINDLYKKKVIFINNKTEQYLVGFYEKDSYYIRYNFPKNYVPHKNKSTFETSLKDFLIGAPH